MTLNKNLKNIKIFINNINMPKEYWIKTEVYNGTAKRTTGGLEKDLFIINMDALSR